MDFLFDLPLFLSGPLLVALLVGTSLLGLEWFRRTQLPRLRFGNIFEQGCARPVKLD